VTDKKIEHEVGVPLANNSLSDAQIKRRLDALSAADCWRLQQVARIYADGTSWSAADLLQETFVAALDRRSWRADLETTVFLTGVMRSLAFSRRKSELVDALDAGLRGGGDDPEAGFATLAADESQEPGAVLSAQEDQHIFLDRLEQMFADDPQVLRVVEGRALGESAHEIRSALAVTETQYETICRRLLRRYQNSRGDRL
jgi:DNA-directed RNA polymerase specialized sigma24 family protein